MTPTLTEYWDLVEERITEAKLIAFDGCHKIYLAMDDTEADWFRANYDHVVEGTPSTMLATLHDWFDASCGLRFIQSVASNPEDPNAGFESLIPQGADWEDEDEDDDDPWDGYGDD